MNSGLFKLNLNDFLRGFVSTIIDLLKYKRFVVFKLRNVGIWKQDTSAISCYPLAKKGSLTLQKVHQSLIDALAPRGVGVANHQLLGKKLLRVSGRS